ncbi:hypothetical protein ACSSS7_002036 [Eimeria intestinalis]
MQIPGPSRERADVATSSGNRVDGSSPRAPAAASPLVAALAVDAGVQRTAAVPLAPVDLESNAELHGTALRETSAYSPGRLRPEEVPPLTAHPHALAACRHSHMLLSSGEGSSPVKRESPSRIAVSSGSEVTVSAAAAAAATAAATAAKPAVAAAEQAVGAAAPQKFARAAESSVAGAESAGVTANALKEAAAVAANTSLSAAEASAASAAALAAEQPGADALAATSAPEGEAAAGAAAEGTGGTPAAAATRAASARGMIAAPPGKSTAGELAARPPANEANLPSAAASAIPPSSECGVHPCETAQRETAPIRSISSRSSSNSNRSRCSYEEEAVLAAAALALELETDLPDLNAAAASAAGLTDAAAAAAAAAAEVRYAAASAGKPTDTHSLEKELEGLLGEVGAAAAADLMARAYRRRAPGDPRDRGAASSSGGRDPEAAARATITAVALAAAKALEHHRARNPVASSANETNHQLPQQEQQQQGPQQQPLQRQGNRQNLLEKQMECLRLLLLTGCLNPRWKTYTNPQAFQLLMKFPMRLLPLPCGAVEASATSARNLEVINGRWDLSPPSATQGAAAPAQPQRNTRQVESPHQAGSAGAGVSMTKMARTAAREPAAPEQAAQARPPVRYQSPHIGKSILRQEQRLSVQGGSEGFPTALYEESSSGSKSSSSSSSGSSSAGNRQGHLIRTLESFLSSRRLKKRPVRSTSRLTAEKGGPHTQSRLPHVVAEPEKAAVEFGASSDTLRQQQQQQRHQQMNSGKAMLLLLLHARSLLLAGEAASSQSASEETGPMPQIRHGYVAHMPENPPQRQQPKPQPTTAAGHGLYATAPQQQRQHPQQHEPSDEEGSEAGPDETSDEEDASSPPQSDQSRRAERQQQQQQQEQLPQQQGSVQITRSGRRVTFAFRVSDLINDDEQPPSPEAATAAAAREADNSGQHRPKKS